MPKDDAEDLPLFASAKRGPTLADARAEFWSKLRDGSRCPCCDRYGKIYRRKLNSAMATTLIKMYRYEASNPGWIHMISVGNFGLPSRDYGTLQHWGLTETSKGSKDDGNPDSGLWRLTRLGRDFVEGKVSVPRYVYLYNDSKIEVDEPEAAELVKVHEALGSKFDYQEMIRA